MVVSFCVSCCYINSPPFSLPTIALPNVAGVGVDVTLRLLQNVFYNCQLVAKTGLATSDILIKIHILYVIHGGTRFFKATERTYSAHIPVTKGYERTKKVHSWLHTLI